MPDAAKKLPKLPSIDSVMARVNAGFPLNTNEAAVYLGDAPSTLEKKRCFGTGPKFYKSDGASGAVRYDIPDLIAYKQARRRQSTSDPGPQIRDKRAPARAERSTPQQRREAPARPRRSRGQRRAS